MAARSLGCEDVGCRRVDCGVDARGGASCEGSRTLELFVGTSNVEEGDIGGDKGGRNLRGDTRCGDGEGGRIFGDDDGYGGGEDRWSLGGNGVCEAGYDAVEGRGDVRGGEGNDDRNGDSQVGGCEVGAGDGGGEFSIEGSADPGAMDDATTTWVSDEFSPVLVALIGSHTTSKQSMAKSAAHRARTLKREISTIVRAAAILK